MENFKTDQILKLLLPHWKKLSIVAVISIIVGFVISSPMVIKPLYKSYSIVYPVNLSPSSEESNTEQLLQWFNSEEIKKAVAEKFNLYQHYEIDTMHPKHVTYFNLRYKELVSINSTLYESIEISVKDQSPEMAQQIVQGIIDATNNLIATVKKERLKEYIINNEKEYNTEIHAIDSMQNVINKIREENNIINVEFQAKALTKKLYKGKALSGEENKTWDAIKHKETEIRREKSNFENELGTFNYFRNEVNKFKYEYESNISFTNVVSKPTLPDSKCYPIRSLIVAIITLSTLLIACLVIIFSNNKK
jgi:capsule polysaccharide export protein KpsE/RkpR